MFDTSLTDLDFHSWSQLYEKLETSALIFLQISGLIWMKLDVLPHSPGVFKFMLNVVHRISIQGKAFSLGDLIKNTSNIGLHPDAYQLISFKLDKMIDMTKLYSLIPV